MATMVTQTRLSVTLCVYCLSCYIDGTVNIRTSFRCRVFEFRIAGWQSVCIREVLLLAESIENFSCFPLLLSVLQ